MRFRNDPKPSEEKTILQPEKTVNHMAISDNPMVFSQETFIEGFLKTKKSIRMECKFTGTILSTQKITVESTAVIDGDIICNDLVISGKIKGNIFCVGKIKVENNAEINGNIYTKRFENEENTNLNCVISVPNNEEVEKIQHLLNNIDCDVKLSTDTLLAEIKNFFESDLTRKLSPKKTGSKAAQEA